LIAAAVGLGAVTWGAANVWGQKPGPGECPHHGMGVGPADCPCDGMETEPGDCPCGMGQGPHRGKGMGRAGRGPRGGGPGWDGRGWGGPGLGIERMADMLDLTSEQRDQVRQILKDSSPAMKTFIEKEADTREALSDAVHAEKIDEGAIRKAASDLAGSAADLAVARARVAEKVRGILTPEQSVKLKEHRIRMQERRRIHRERMRGGAGAQADGF